MGPEALVGRGESRIPTTCLPWKCPSNHRAYKTECTDSISLEADARKAEQPQKVGRPSGSGSFGRGQEGCVKAVFIHCTWGNGAATLRRGAAMPRTCTTAAQKCSRVGGKRALAEARQERKSNLGGEQGLQGGGLEGETLQIETCSRCQNGNNVLFRFDWSGAVNGC